MDSTGSPLPTRRNRRFHAARAHLQNAVDYLIQERRRKPSGSDLLSMLIEARDEETGESMTDLQIRVEVTTFLLAGQETTALALTWLWYLLSQHERPRQRLTSELDAVLNGRRLEPADLANLPYTRMAIDETLRQAVSAGMGVFAAGDRRRYPGRISPAARLAGVRDPVRPAPAACVLGRPGAVRARTVLA